MKVTEITARYMRRIQIESYQPAEAEVSLRAQVTEGEEGPDSGNAVKAAQDLLVQARSAVHSVLLGAVKGQSPGGAVAAQATTTATPPSAQPSIPAEPATPPAETVKTEKAVKGKKKDEKPTPPVSDIPDEVTTAAPSKNDIPEETAPTAKVTAKAAPIPGAMTATELQTHIAEKIKAKKLTVPQMRDLMDHADFKVVRLGDLSEAQIIDFKARLDKMTEAA